MSSDPISAVFDFGATAIKSIWGNKDKQAEELRKLEEVYQKGDATEVNAHVQLMLAQMKINAIDAAHPHWFVSGWRPGVGWLGVIAMFYNIVLYNIMVWTFKMMQVFDVIPYYKIVKLVENGSIVEKIITIMPPGAMDAGPIFAMVTAMLGIGVQRSYDKRHGTDTRSIT